MYICFSESAAAAYLLTPVRLSAETITHTMGKFYSEIPDNESTIGWMKAQQLFHVATAPLNGTPSVYCVLASGIS